MQPLTAFASAWQGVVAFINGNVTMPDVPFLAESMRNKTYPRYKAPHVENQPDCEQLAANPMDPNQPRYGCNNETCPNGCVRNLPSMYNPGPSFANETHSVNLVRIHKASVHYTCVRSLLILQRECLANETEQELHRHTYTLVRVLMKPAPGYAWTHKDDFRKNIASGNYSTQPSGVWQMWQTGTVGLRTMDLPPAANGELSPPSPNLLQFTGVTQDEFKAMPGQMVCWDPMCLGQPQDCVKQSVC
jgi:hypothetical protein